jgi:hypothetical protein
VDGKENHELSAVLRISIQVDRKKPSIECTVFEFLSKWMGRAMGYLGFFAEKPIDKFLKEKDLGSFRDEAKTRRQSLQLRTGEVSENL